MSIPPESIEVGKCYLTAGNIVRRVVKVLPDQRIQYEWRGGYRTRWKAGILISREFALAVEREVHCDWTPEQEE